MSNYVREVLRICKHVLMRIHVFFFKTKYEYINLVDGCQKNYENYMKK